MPPILGKPGILGPSQSLSPGRYPMSDLTASDALTLSATPPYAAYATFESFIERAAHEEVPPRVDKALLVGWEIARGNESGLLTTLKVLGVIDEAGEPTPDYRELRLSPPRRRAALQRCLQRAYSGLLAEGATHPATSDALHDYLVGVRGLRGQMLDKAKRFYRQLVQAANGAADLPATDRETTPRPPPSPAPVARRGRTRRPAPEQSSRPPTTLPVGTVPPFSPVGHPAVAASVPGAGTYGLTLVVEVPLDADEAALTALFRRVRRAWSAAGESNQPGTTES
jgi:hypothetical protein